MKPVAALLFVSLLPASVMAQSDLSFTARTISGEIISVGGNASTKLTVICFLGAECPMARVYGPRLSELADLFQDRGVQFIGINSNRQDSLADIREYVDSLKISFPFIHDTNNVIANQFEATRTPEVFVLDAQLQVQYQGRIDDQYAPGISRAAPSRHDLRKAIDELLSGQPVTVAKTPALGCIIGKVTRLAQRTIVQNDITYCRHVARVLQQHCVECHRAGEIGPFAMDSYGEVAGWADTILETIDNGRMPPWHADPEHGSFQNARVMPKADQQLLHDWVAGGLKEGDTSDLPAPPQYVDGWQLDREPDQVVAMRNRPFIVPADGVVEYQYFVADPGFTEDKWLTAAQVIPGARSVVHHAIVFVRPPDGSRFRGVGWLSAYVPGQRMIPLPPGRARRVPAGSRLVFQMHYTPNGMPAEDVTRIGLQFGQEQDVTHEVFTLVGLDQEFEIPPHTESYSTTAKVPWLPEHGELLAATPHMHFRGKSFRIFTGTDNRESLLSVPNYDFNWQHTYALKKPVALSSIDELRFEATFDNSSSNPFNPDPSQTVTWGDQTWEEMAVVFFEVSEPRQKPESATTETLDIAAGRVNRAKVDAYVNRCFEKMDANQDGVIRKEEAPIVVRFFNFHYVDKDRNGTATRDEVRQVAEQIYR